MRKNSKINMAEGPLLKNIILFSIPIILTNLLQTLYNAADVVVVGNYAGKEALGAVGSTGSITNLIVAMFVNLTVGTSVIMARNYGAKDYEEADKTLHTSIALGILSGIIMLFAGVFLARPALEMMQTPAEILDGAVLYMIIYFLGMPAFLFFNFGAAVMRATGDSKRPLQYLTISGVINVVLNLILVIVFHMGVAGVAIATIVAQYISAVLVFFSLRKSGGFCRLDMKKLKIDKKIFVEILRLGIPAGIQSVIFSISNVIAQSAINSFNSVAVSAGNSVATNIENFVYMAQNAVATTAVTAVSQCVGAKNYDRINKSLYYSIGVVSVVGISLSAIICLMPDVFVSLYNSDPEVLQVCIIKFMYLCAPYFLCGVMEVVVSAIRGLGTSFLPMCVSIVGVCGVRIIWVYTVFEQMHTLEALFVSYPISWFVTTAAHFICYFIYKKKFMRKVRLQEAMV